MNQNNSLFNLITTPCKLFEKQVVDQILLGNQKSKSFGLQLSKNQAVALFQTQTQVLNETKRIEFGNRTIQQLILAFCDSSYLHPDNYEDTLHELIRLFYNLKNDTWDTLSDQAIIDFMQTAFNGCCHGCFPLLQDLAFQLIEHIHNGQTLKTFHFKE